MIADFFTKPLQGVLFKKLRDMIMGNTTIKLPSDMTTLSDDETKGIPIVSPQLESRSVLEGEIVKYPRSNSDSSAYVNTRLEKSQSRVHSLTVLPAHGKTNEITTSNITNRKRTPSWAEIASRPRKE